jgi:ferredoxin
MPETGITELIRVEARRLLEDGVVDVVVGFEGGSVPGVSAPCFVRRPEDCGRLVWNPFCSGNLAVYLPGMTGRTGIVAKGCDSRAIVELIKEKQVKREDLVILGVPCRGMIGGIPPEMRKQGTAVGVTEEGGNIVFHWNNSSTSIPREELLLPECRVCTRKNPVVFDIPVAPSQEEQSSPGFPDVSEFAALPPDQRWAYITGEMDRCIRCYACRNVCPLCYCRECFADSADPRWIGKGADATDNLVFHLIRSLHLAGRCVECGACRRACPMNVDFGILGRKLSEDVLEMFGCSPGLDAASAPLATFRADDPEEFMLDPEACGKHGS